MIVLKYWTKQKFHNNFDIKKNWYENTHKCRGYFLFGFIPLIVIQKEL